MENQWVIQEDPHFGAWEWTIPIDQANPDQIFKAMLEIWGALQISIWRIHSGWESIDDYISDATDYYRKTGVLYVMDALSFAESLGIEGEMPGSKLSVFDIDGSLVSAWMNAPGLFLRECFAEQARLSNKEMEDYPAIRIWGGKIKLAKANRYVFGAKLHSNIWYPSVLPPQRIAQHLEWDNDKINILDNSILAWENAQNLNYCVQTLNMITAKWGGETDFLRPANDFYRQQISQNGILI
jgi:hypothetical protein